MTARSSLFLSFIQRYAILAIRLISLIVLSRLITPAELGVFVAASAVIAIINVVADFGLTQFVVQAEALAPRLERSIMGSALVTSWSAGLVGLGISILAPAEIAGEDVRLAIAALSLTFLASPFTAIATGKLQREMRFRDLASVTVFATAASVALAIVLAVRGMGFMSLVWGTVAESALMAVMLARLSPPMWPSLDAWRTLFRFGWVWTGTTGMKQLSDAAVRLGVTAALGLSAAGILARAQNALLMFDRLVLDAVGVVLLPTLSSRLRQGGDIASIRRIMLTHVSATAWPFFTVAAIAADPMIRTLLGPLWVEAIGPFRILCLGGLFLPFSGLAILYFVSLGMMRDYLPYQAGVQAVKAALAVAGSLVSLELVCLALAIEPALKGLFAERILRRRIGSANLDAPAMAGSALATLSAAAGALLGLAVTSPATPPVLALLLAGSLAIAFWLVTLVLIAHPIVGELRHMADRGLALLRRSPLPRR